MSSSHNTRPLTREETVYICDEYSTEIIMALNAMEVPVGETTTQSHENGGDTEIDTESDNEQGNDDTEMDFESGNDLDSGRAPALTEAFETKEIFIVPPRKDIVLDVLREISVGNVALVKGSTPTSSLCWDAASISKHLGVRAKYYHRIDKITVEDFIINNPLQKKMGSKDILYIPSAQWSLPDFMTDLDDSYQCIWASSPYFELPQAVGMTHSFVHLIGQASTPMGGSEWFTTPYESTEGYCVQFQVQYGKTALFLIQQGDYSKISSWPDLAKCILQTKAIIDSPDLSGRPLSAYQVRRLSLHAGDCVVIPPGMIFFFSKRRSCSIISGCKFLCKETLHLTYPWMRVADFSNTDETIGKYWAVVKEAVAKDTKLGKIMYGDDAALFQGDTLWVSP